MAMQKRFGVKHGDVFPQGAFIKGSVEQVIDFDKSSKDNRVQAVDLNARGEGTGLPLWQVMVLDADEEAGKKDTALSIKIAAKHQPVPPENKTQFPWTPVEFTGLTALPYIEESATGRSRIVWSFRAEGMVSPGASAAPVKGAA